MSTVFGRGQDMLKMIKYVLVFMYLLVNVVADDHNVTSVNTTMDGHNNVSVPTDCTIDFNQTEVKHYRELTNGTDNKLVYIHFRFLNHTGKLLHEDHGDIFEPLSWVHVSGHQGKSLLNLLYHYEALSIHTMSVGVEHTTITVTESQPGCLADQPTSVVGLYFRDALLNNFYNMTLLTKKTLGESTNKLSKSRICHMTIGKEGTVAKFFYTCCHINKHGDPVCEELEADSWMQLVGVFIIITNILVIAFCPFLVPEYYYSDTKGSIRYTQESETERKPVTILKTSVPKNAVSRSNIVREKLVSKYMPDFSKTLHKLRKDQSYQCNIRTVEFVVKHRDLISESDVPVGILSTIYNNFARCEIRHHSSSSACCKGKMLSFAGCSVQWYQCLSRLMSTVVLAIVSIPWILRVIFYAVYERNHFEGRTVAAEARQLDTQYEANISLYLSPLHTMFLLCYTVIIIEGMCFGMLHKNVTRHIRVLLRECFQKMRHSSRVNLLGKMCSFLLIPCTKWGIFGLLVFPFMWVFVLPVCLVVATFYYIPIVNLTLRLIGSLFVNILPTTVCTGRPKTLDSDYGDTSEPSHCTKCLSKVRHILLTSFCLLALYSLLFLFVEFTQFVVVVAIYTIMGIILNSSFAMQYVPLLFMVAVYGHTTFGDVYKKYMRFNKTVQKHVLEIFKNTSSTAKYELMSTDSNTAFEVCPEGTESSTKDFISVNNSNFTWSSRRAVLFVDKHGTPYIRKKFFFNCCQMDHYAAPGSLFSNLINAVCRFLIIISFLLFVGLVVVAFSENFELSATNQTLIALAGGLIPFVLTNFLFREVELPEVENDVRFNRYLNDIISNYKEDFEVIDFKCTVTPGTVVCTDSDSEMHTQSSIPVQLKPIMSLEMAGTNGHAMAQNNETEMSTDKPKGLSLGLGTIGKYADDSVNLPETENEHGTNQVQVSNGKEQTTNGLKQPDEQTLQDNNVEIVSEQPKKTSVSNETSPEDQTTQEGESSSTSGSQSSSQSSSLSSVLQKTKPQHQLNKYDVVVDISKDMTATQYFISMI